MVTSALGPLAFSLTSRITVWEHYFSHAFGLVLLEYVRGPLHRCCVSRRVCAACRCRPIVSRWGVPLLRLGGEIPNRDPSHYLKIYYSIELDPWEWEDKARCSFYSISKKTSTGQVGLVRGSLATGRLLILQHGLGRCIDLPLVLHKGLILLHRVNGGYSILSLSENSEYSLF